MATYPTGIPSIAADKSNNTLAAGDHAAHHNTLAAELVAIATELGVNPSGAASDVASRLTTLASDLSALQTTVGGLGGAVDATTLTKGIVRLAGDLGGTAASPTVPSLAGKQDTSAKGQTNGYASLDGTGKVPTAQLPAASSFSWTAVVRQAADLTNATTTPANTDLIFTFAANGVYAVDLYLLCTSAAATTGYGFAFDTSVAVTTVALTFNHVLANAGTLSGGNSIADNTPLGLSSGVNAANTVTPIMGTAVVVAGANAGTARLTFRPEVAASAVLKANSVMRVHQAA